MSFAFIQAEKAHFPVTVLCSVLGVSRSGFYAWQAAEPSRRRQEDERLGVAIAAIHRQSRHTYGAPRIQAELREQGLRLGKKRVARLMRERGLAVTLRRRKHPRQDGGPAPATPIAENVLDRQFTKPEPNQAWVGDITYVRTGEGWLYLAVLLDLHARRVVGWSMSDTIDRHLAIGALTMAVANRGVPQGLVHHTDRGSQYTSDAYRTELARLGFKPSHSRRGNCWDNAVSESFFATLKLELVYRQPFASRESARRAIFEYIEVFYNRQRRHSRLGYLSPVEFEKRFGVQERLPA